MEARILKLEASAGSGKTYRLVQTFLERLFLTFAGHPEHGGDAVEEARRLLPTVLAVTFTIKAANEMKARILERLQQFALAHRGHLLADAEAAAMLATLGAATGLSETRIVALAERIMETMLAAYEDFNVRTIDSLMSAMIKVLSPDLGLPPDFEIGVEMGARVRQAAREHIAMQADQDWPMVAGYLQELRTVRGLGSWTPDEELALQLEKLFQLGLRQDLEPDPPPVAALRQCVSEQLADFSTRLATLYEIMVREPRTDRRCKHLKGTAVNPALLSAIAGFLAAGRSAMALLDKLIDKAFFSKQQPQELTTAAAPPEFDADFTVAYHAMRVSLSVLLFNRSLERVAGFRDFLNGFIDHWRRQRHPLYVGEFAHELERKLREWPDGVYPYIYLKLSDRLHHFLFDEFQDTSELQFKALAPLIEEVLASEPAATLFIVGDRKQAIYRWRGGNAELMDEALLRRIIPQLDHVAPGPFSLPLQVNYRSGNGIVAFNNEFWDPQQIAGVSEEPRLQEAIRRNFADSRQLSGRPQASGYVEIRLLAAADNDDEPDRPLLDQVVAMITDARTRGWGLQDMAVLCRFNDDVRHIMSHLGAAGIDCISEQSLVLAAHPVIGELLALLRFLDYPPDDLNFYAFVHGRVFDHAAGRFPGTLTAFRDEALLHRREPLYKVFQRLCPVLWRELLAPHFRAVGFLPVYDLVSDLIQTFRLYGEFPDCAPYLLTFMDMLHEQEQTGVHSVAAFLQCWQEDRSGPQPRMVKLPQTTAAVRVMTIHQAKGLQFPLVILPLNDRMERNTPEPIVHAGHIHLIDATSARLCPELGEIEAGETEKLLLDRLNLLYVAFTRPQSALLIPLLEPRRTANAPRRLGLASLLLNHPRLRKCEWPATWGVMAARDLPPPELPGIAPPLVDKCITTRDWQRDFLVFTARTRSPADEAARRGALLHLVLAQVTPGADLDAQLDELATAHGLTARDADRLRRFLADKRLAALFRPDCYTVPEKELAVPVAGRWQYKRIDRLLLAEDGITVLEFKTGGRDPAHHRQVADYAAAVRAIYPGRACRALLLYIDEAEIEEVPC